MVFKYNWVWKETTIKLVDTGQYVMIDWNKGVCIDNYIDINQTKHRIF